METLTLVNGNDQKYKIELPKLVILDDYINEVALKHIAENTGLNFTKTVWNYEAQPSNSQQIVKLFLTYNFKTQYHNNITNKNTLYLKGDHHVGFKVDNICYECVKRNNISVRGLKRDSLLMC